MDDHIGKTTLLSFFAENYKNKSVKIKKEYYSLLQLFEDQKTETTRSYPVKNTLT